jgi:hypothetical protein
VLHVNLGGRDLPSTFMPELCSLSDGLIHAAKKRLGYSFNMLQPSRPGERPVEVGRVTQPELAGLEPMPATTSQPPGHPHSQKSKWGLGI